ncbi:MAG: hypothetical protein ACREM3_28055, partial [Candidatus Rokuibacteriota bacterium]
MARRRLAVGVVLLLGLLDASGAAAQKPRAERPTYAVGDSWPLDIGTYTLSSIGQGVYVFVAGPGEEIHLGRDLGVSRVVRGGLAELELWPPPALKWPLEVGKWGITDVSARRNGAPLSLPYCTAAPRFVWRIEAYEDVAVGGTTVKAFRIAGSVESPGLQGCLLAQVTTWYAPALGRIVRLASGGQYSSAFSLAAPTAVAARPQPAPPPGPGEQAKGAPAIMGAAPGAGAPPAVQR